MRSRLEIRPKRFAAPWGRSPISSRFWAASAPLRAVDNSFAAPVGPWKSCQRDGRCVSIGRLLSAITSQPRRLVIASRGVKNSRIAWVDRGAPL